MFMNFVMFAMCIVIAIWCFFKREIGMTIMQIVGAILNLPFAIAWFRNL